MSTPKTPVASRPRPLNRYGRCVAEAFAAEYSVRPVPAAGPVDTTPICNTPAAA